MAALEAMLALRALAEERVAIELVSAEPHFWYRPLAVAEPFGLWQVGGIDLAGIADTCAAGFTLGRLTSVEPDAHRAWTAAGAEFGYDLLVIACGAKATQVLPGALSFRGFVDVDGELLQQVAAGAVRRLVFALPGSVVWSLPLYELALITHAFLAKQGVGDVELTVVTHEEAPLALFGKKAGRAIAALLAERGISLQTGQYPRVVREGKLLLVPRGAVAADRVVALPRLEGGSDRGHPP